MRLPARRGSRFVFGLHTQAWIALGWGLPLALLITWWKPLGTVLMPLPVIIHELGHAVAAWVFGRPAIPAFDFHYGGGVTRWFDQVPGLVVVVMVAMLYLGWRMRRRPVATICVGAGVVVYSLLAWNKGHMLVIEASGHGFELLFAGVFLYRAFTGLGLRLSVERPLYGMLGLWFLFHNLAFANQLLTNPAARAEYAAAKGGGDWMDFAQLSRDLNMEFSLVVGCYLILCLMVVPLAFIAANETRGHRVAQKALPGDMDLQETMGSSRGG